MEPTWTVPVALILAAAGYLAVAQVIRHRERMAQLGRVEVPSPAEK